MNADPDRTPLVNISPAWRYSLKQLLIATTMIALGCVALRNASSTWVAAMFGLTLIVLAGASLCAAFRSGQRRAFWIGFAACGWLYVLVLMYGWSLAKETDPNPLTSYRLATTRLARWTHEKWFPTSTRKLPTSVAFPYGVGAGDPDVAPPPGTSIRGYSFMSGTTTVHFQGGPEVSNYVDVAHALWTLLFALCGGWFARWLYVRGPGRTSGAGLEPAETSRAG